MEESHFLTMMRMVQPHVSGRPKRSVELMLQSADLLHSVQQYREPELSACDTGQDYVDFEAMLTDLQTVCNPAEAEFVNLILNFFRSRKIYSAYRVAASQQNFEQNQEMQKEVQKAKETSSMETSYSLPTEPDLSAVLSAAEKKESDFAENSQSNATSNQIANEIISQTTNETANQTTNASKSAMKEKHKPNVKRNQGPANAFRNLMGNQALQSLLSPAQKENLNQIESLMQVLS